MRLLEEIDYDRLERVIELVLACAARGGMVYFIGNGGSAAIASHQATDWAKNGRIRAKSFSDVSLLTCLANDFGYEHGYAKAVEYFLTPDDLLVAISSSGRSPNILNAVDKARAIGTTVVTLSGFDGDNPLRARGIENVYVNSRVYGHVEICHLFQLHYIVDRIMERQRPAVGRE